MSVVLKLKPTSTMEISEDIVPKILPQIVAALAVATSSFSLGAVLAWTSPSIPDLEKRGSLGILSLEDKSWIASLVNIGALVCGPFSGYLLEKCGRRGSLQIFAVIMTIGWCLISSGLNVAVVCVGRFLTGFAMGGNLHIATLYLSEISQEKIRGVLNSIAYVEIGLGILYIYILGSFASWFTLSVTNIAFPVISFISLCFIPESPIHLMNKGKLKEARNSLMWLRGADHFQQIESELRQLQEMGRQSSYEKSGVREKVSIFTAGNMRALAIVLTLMICQQLSGVNAVLFYALFIFQTAGTELDPNMCSIIVGVVILFSVFINLALIDRLGRRVLLIISQLGMASALFALGLFFHLKKENDGVTPPGLSFLPLLCLVLFMIIYNVGAGPVPFIMMGELLPPEIKRYGSAFATSFNWTLAFLVTKYFESLVVLLGIHVCYFLFSGICCLGLIFCIMCVPETRGKSLDEIQRLYFPK